MRRRQGETTSRGSDHPWSPTIQGRMSAVRKRKPAPRRPFWSTFTETGSGKVKEGFQSTARAGPPWRSTLTNATKPGKRKRQLASQRGHAASAIWIFHVFIVEEVELRKASCLPKKSERASWTLRYACSGCLHKLT